MSLGSVVARTADMAACYGSSHSTAWPNTLYLALFNGNPGSGGSELTIGTGGYARLAINNDGTNFTVSAGAATNSTTWSFAVATGAYSGTFSYWGFLDASTGGNLYDYGPLVSITDGTTLVTGGPLAAGAQVVFATGTVVISAP